MTTPTGKLQWGQAGVYDAVDDRSVIAAVTRNRTGLVQPIQVRAGTGLDIIVSGGWLGVASCGDFTSAVVGSRLDHIVQAVPGPASGSRADVIWCDVEPDEGTWELRVIPQSAAAGRAGVLLAFITVPANASLASQMDLLSAGARLERRILIAENVYDTRVVTGLTWETADTIIWGTTTVEPGQWYRVRFTASSPMMLAGQMQARIGIGNRFFGAPNVSSVLMRASTISFPRLNAETHAEVEYTFRQPVDAAFSERHFDGRIWIAGTSGQIRVQNLTTQGPGLSLTVEDVGS